MRKMDLIYKISFLGLFIGLLAAQDKTLEMEDLHRSPLNVSGFKLEKEREIRIKAIGAGGDEELRTRDEHKDISNMYAYGWIIDAKSRKMVWRMTVDNTDRYNHSDINRVFDDKVLLDKGVYEVYFYSMEKPFWGIKDSRFSIKNLLERLLEKDEKWRDYGREWELSISGVDEIYDERDVLKIQNKMKADVFVDLTEIRDNDMVTAGFTLKERLRVNIYALGERVDSKMYDYGWIENADTWRKVWTMEDEETDHAGGATKNRKVDVNITLKPGNYLVKYRADDSHSYREWNSNPPYDPGAWGITVRPADREYNPDIIEEFAEEKVEPIVSINRVGDYAYKEEAFKLKEDARIRIYALGEGRSGEMFDYAWITEARTGRIVWKMRYHKTRHAGGASKNRLYDDIIGLDAGSYIAHYQSDDSHSYEEWNSSPPQDPEMWGLTIYPVGDQDVIEHVSKVDLDENIIAKIVRVGDDEHIRKEFTLDEETDIRIYCIGEGDEDEMYDYGWIENARTGRTVWRMRYRSTDHAGGAPKNRVADTVITLDEGRYRVHYKSDDSHSYYDWNARAPFDQRNWGITIYRLD